MYSLRLYHDDSLVKITLAQPLEEDQLQTLGRDLEQHVLAGDHRLRSVLVDQTRAEPLASELTTLLTTLQVQLLQESDVSIAHIVGSELVAHQLDRVVESQQTGRRLRYFWEDGSALAWLSTARKSVPTP